MVSPEAITEVDDKTYSTRDGRLYIYISENSINYLIKNARFTICLNGGTLVDNFIIGSPVLSLAKSMFYKTNALVYSEKFKHGINIMINKNYDYEIMLQKQKELVWWLYNNSLFYDKSVEDNIKVIEKHLNITF